MKTLIIGGPHDGTRMEAPGGMRRLYLHDRKGETWYYDPHRFRCEDGSILTVHVVPGVDPMKMLEAHYPPPQKNS